MMEHLDPEGLVKVEDPGTSSDTERDDDAQEDMDASGLVPGPVTSGLVPSADQLATITAGITTDHLSTEQLQQLTQVGHVRIRGP